MSKTPFDKRRRGSSEPRDRIKVYECECGLISLSNIPYSHSNLGQVHQGTVCVGGKKTESVYQLGIWKVL